VRLTVESTTASLEQSRLEDLCPTLCLLFSPFPAVDEDLLEPQPHGLLVASPVRGEIGADVPIIGLFDPPRLEQERCRLLHQMPAYLGVVAVEPHGDRLAVENLFAHGLLEHDPPLGRLGPSARLAHEGALERRHLARRDDDAACAGVGYFLAASRDCEEGATQEKEVNERLAAQSPPPAAANRLAWAHGCCAAAGAETLATKFLVH
jgi:hypothetical protein